MTLAELLKRLVLVFCIGLLGSSVQTVEAQARADGPDIYGAKNKFGVMVEYSNDSSHIIFGQSENIKLGAAGLQYQHRLLARHSLVWSYEAEFRPVILESIPATQNTLHLASPSTVTVIDPPVLTTRCVRGSYPFTQSVGDPPVQYSGTISVSCSRQTNFAQGLSPFGMRLNFRPGHRLQPTISTLEGYIFSTKPLPTMYAGSFNFAFEFGAGLEYYLAPKRSVRLEYQLQHYSNGYTANANPGVDSGMFKLSYSFGR